MSWWYLALPVLALWGFFSVVGAYVLYLAARDRIAHSRLRRRLDLARLRRWGQ
jgi:hypothetical protein